MALVISIQTFPPVASDPSSCRDPVLYVDACFERGSRRGHIRLLAVCLALAIVAAEIFYWTVDITSVVVGRRIWPCLKEFLLSWISLREFFSSVTASKLLISFKSISVESSMPFLIDRSRR
jgi:hypothetical protein